MPVILVDWYIGLYLKYYPLKASRLYLGFFRISWLSKSVRE